MRITCKGPGQKGSRAGAWPPHGKEARSRVRDATGEEKKGKEREKEKAGSLHDSVSVACRAQVPQLSSAVHEVSFHTVEPSITLTFAPHRSPVVSRSISASIEYGSVTHAAGT